ncbi:TPA: IS4 family transposase, partial [Escherichia coli]
MPPPSTQLFAEHLPTEWIQHLLTLSAHATICRLNLSADGEAGISLLA